MINHFFEFLLKLIGNKNTVVLLFAVFPFSEARLAIPIALSCGITPFKAFMLAFIGSSLAAALLLVCMLPLIKLLSKTKLFKRLAESILTKAQGKAESLGGQSNKGDKAKMLALCGFLSLPLPLTGVYMGSLLAAALGLKYHKALISILIGNFISAIIITVTGVFFNEYISIMVTVFTVIALFALAMMLIKAFLPKRVKKG